MYISKANSKPPPRLSTVHLPPQSGDSVSTIQHPSTLPAVRKALLLCLLMIFTSQTTHLQNEYSTEKDESLSEINVLNSASITSSPDTYGWNNPSTLTDSSTTITDVAKIGNYTVAVGYAGDFQLPDSTWSNVNAGTAGLIMIFNETNYLFNHYRIDCPTG